MLINARHGGSYFLAFFWLLVFSGSVGDCGVLLGVSRFCVPTFFLFSFWWFLGQDLVFCCWFWFLDSVLVLIVLVVLWGLGSCFSDWHCFGCCFGLLLVFFVVVGAGLDAFCAPTF